LLALEGTRFPSQEREHPVNEELYYPQLVEHMSDRDSNRGFPEPKLTALEQLQFSITSTTDITRLDNLNNFRTDNTTRVPRGGWEDNITMDLQELGCGDMDCIGLAQDRDR